MSKTKITIIFSGVARGLLRGLIMRCTQWEGVSLSPRSCRKISKYVFIE